MIREILKYPDALLNKKTEPVTDITREIKTLLDDMVETMRFANGIGLAANQIGVLKRVAVLDVPDVGADEAREGAKKHLLKLINPEIIEASGEVNYEEGCLSLPGITADVKRNEFVTLKALDENGKELRIKAAGLLSIAIQHEIDHLDGILFVMRLSRLKRGIILRKFRKLQCVSAA